MALNPIFESINFYGDRCCGVSQVKSECNTGIDSDSVREVLSVWAFSKANPTMVSSGQVKFALKVVFYVCYLDRDGKIQKKECGTDGEGVIASDGFSDGQKVMLTTRTEKTEYENSGVSLIVRAVSSVSAQASSNCAINALKGGENLVLNGEDVTVTKSFDLKEGGYPIEEEFDLPCEVEQVLFHRVDGVVTATQCGVGCIIIDGQAFLTLIALQKGEKCSIIKEMRTVPFRAEVECEEAMPTMQAISYVAEKGIKTDIFVDEQSGRSTASVSANLQFFGKVFSEETVSVVTDVFSPTNEVEVVKQTETCFTPLDLRTETEVVTGRSAVDELPIGVSLLTVAGESVSILEKTATERGIKLTGIVSGVAYFIDSDGSVFTKYCETAFEKELTGEHLVFDVDCDVDVVAKAQKASAKIVSAVEVELEAEISFTLYPLKKHAVSVIKDIKCGEEKAENPHAISVYIGVEGEELWSLAKRLNVCPESLIATNKELSFPLTGKERIVVYRQN